MKLCPTTSNTPLAPLSEAFRAGTMARSTCIRSGRRSRPPAIDHHERDREHHQSECAQYDEASQRAKAESVAKLRVQSRAQRFYAIRQRIRTNYKCYPMRGPAHREQRAGKHPQRHEEKIDDGVECLCGIKPPRND